MNPVEDPQGHLKQLRAMAKFGEFALRSNQLQEILTEGCRLVGEALGTDLAKVMELQEDGTSLLVRAGVGWKPGVVGELTLKAAENTSEGFALKTGKPMISPDIAKETRFKYPLFLVDNGVRAVANVIIIGGRGNPPFGILQIDSRTPREFTQENIAFLQGYANLLAGAVSRLVAIKALEATVAERTHKLIEVNAQLRIEAEERERMGDAVRQASKMEAIGQLTGGLAHDFNNLLAGISGSLELMQMRTAQGQARDLERYIETAMVAANRAAALTHRLLAFSRRQTLDPKPTDENKLIRGMEDLFNRTIGPSIHIVSKLAAGLWPTLCDPNQLENALLNLVINARDAMPDGGQMVIETANIVFPDRRGASKDRLDVPPGDYVVLTVTDSGTGMAPDVLARAFDPFFTTKPTGQGTGLGLSMVYGFVQQSEGHVHLRSRSGQGTTVTIYLPRAHESNGDEDNANLVSLPAQATTSAVVLVVEDEPAVRMIVTDVLSSLNYTVLEASDSRSGMNILISKAIIHLLLTDVGLPGGMNGRQLADAARQQRPDLKVLFMTGYAESSVFANGQLDSRTQVMTKPFLLNALVDRVRGMIDA